MASDPDTSQEAAPEEKPKLNLDVQVEEKGACQRHVTVTVPREDIERYFKDAFDELAPKAEVPGFRPGRAPRKLVESRFRDRMGEQVKGSLLMDSISQVSEESDFSAISEPDFDFEAVELPEEGPLTFEFDIEVRPEFELPEWKGLTLERPTHEYTEEEVDEQLRKLLARSGRLVPKDGPAEAGDRVSLGIVFRSDSRVLSEVEDATVEIKPTLSFADGNLEGFDELMSGARPGDRRHAKVRVSEEAPNEDLQGQEVDAEIEVKDVRRLDLPELTPSFLDRIGGFEDEEHLRDTVRQELERQLTYYQQREIRNQITRQLTRDADWELPPDLLRRQASRELERAVLELQSSGFGQDTIRAHANELRQNSRAVTEQALKEHFIFERIAEEERIEAEPHDFDAEIRMIAEQSNESPRRVRARLEKRGQMDALRNQIIERKVLGLITSHAEFSERPTEPRKEETAAIDHPICGHGAEVPEAKYAGEAEELPSPAERT